MLTVISALIFGLLGLAFLILALALLKKKYSWAGGGCVVLSLFFLALAILTGLLALATQGYRALIREEVAAVVAIVPTGSDHFQAHFRFPDGREESFDLSGDELYVDAHILKWKPLANILGLHTSYALDRVAGRYAKIEDEKKKVRTVFAFSSPRLINIFNLRQKYAFLRPLLDAEYGSATFFTAQAPTNLEIRVSTSGLLIRPVTRRAK
ncbi:MAG: hypothetical protein ACUVWV_15560 [Thermodesulfobacteriota bacterium]